MSVNTKAEQANRTQKIILQMEQNVRNSMEQLERISFQSFQNQFVNRVLERLEKIMVDITKTKNSLLFKVSATNISADFSLITPKKSNQGYSKHITFGFTSQIKSAQDFESLASANDQLYKQFEDMMQKYRYNKQTLNHENQIVLNQWLQNTNHISSININKESKKSTFFNLAKGLIQELSKYESVEEYISSIQLIEHQKIVNQLRSTSLQTSDGEKKWLKQTTKDYLLKMAELLKNQDDNTADEQEIDDIPEQELENIF